MVTRTVPAGGVVTQARAVIAAGETLAAELRDMRDRLLAGDAISPGDYDLAVSFNVTLERWERAVADVPAFLR